MDLIRNSIASTSTGNNVGTDNHTNHDSDNVLVAQFEINSLHNHHRSPNITTTITITDNSNSTDNSNNNNNINNISGTMSTTTGTSTDTISTAISYDSIHNSSTNSSSNAVNISIVETEANASGTGNACVQVRATAITTATCTSVAVPITIPTAIVCQDDGGCISNIIEVDDDEDASSDANTNENSNINDDDDLPRAELVDDCHSHHDTWVNNTNNNINVHNVNNNNQDNDISLYQDNRNLPSYLYDLIHQCTTSTNTTSTIHNHAILQQIATHPSQTSYIHRHIPHRTPLHQACRANLSPVIIRALVEAYPRACFIKDGNGNLPLHLVLASANSGMRNDGERLLEVVRLLLEQEYIEGGNVGMVAVCNDAGATPLHFACDDFQNSQNGNDNDDAMAQIFHLLLSSRGGIQALRTQGKNKCTPLLCLAERSGNSSAARWLVEAWPAALRSVDRDGCGVLHHPAFLGNVEWVQCILELENKYIDVLSGNYGLVCDGDIDSGNDGNNYDDGGYRTAQIRDREGKTPLHYACQGRETIQEKPKDTSSSSCISSQIPREQTIQLLLQAYPAAITIPDTIDGSLPLHYACRNRQPSTQIIRDILHTCSSTTTTTAALSPNDQGWTPLHSACANHHRDTSDIVQLLLATTLNIVASPTEKKDTPLHLACTANSSFETVRYLLKCHKPAMYARNDYGFAPLHCSVRAHRPNKKIVMLLIFADKLYRDRVEGRGDVYIDNVARMKTNGGELPIHLACHNPTASVDIVRLLLDADAPPPTSTPTPMHLANTPLHEACFRNAPYYLISALASSRPDWVSTKNLAGCTPLHLCAKTGPGDDRVPVLQRLIELSEGNEACRSKDNAGHWPLHSACRAGSSPLAIEALLEADPECLIRLTYRGDLPIHLAVARGASSGVLSVLVDAAIGRGSRGWNSGGGGLYEKKWRESLVQKNGDGCTALDILSDRFRGALLRSRSLRCRGAVSLQIPENEDLHFSAEEEALYDQILYLAKAIYDCRDGDEEEDSEDTTKTDASSLEGWNEETIRRSRRRKSGDTSQDTLEVHACLHTRKRFGARSVDKEMVRRVMISHVDQLSVKDTDGNYPLHIEAGVDPLDERDRRGTRIRKVIATDKTASFSMLETILQHYPNAARERNNEDKFPIEIMMENGFYTWLNGMKLVLAACPEPLLWHKGMNDKLVPFILAQLARGGNGYHDVNTMFRIVKNRPDIVRVLS